MSAQTPSTPAMRLVLFTDLVDSTEFMSKMGDAVAAAFWAYHDRAGRDLIRRWRGVEVGRSDGFLLLFDSAGDGLGFALGYHAMLAARQPPVSGRVGAHWGPVSLRANSPNDIAAGATPFEVDGLAIPLASRVMSAARGGQTLFSAAAAESLIDGAPPHDCVSHGHWRLKGVSQPIELLEMVLPGASAVPPDDVAKAHRVVWRDGLWQSARDLPGNIGPEPDAFVGRESELLQLAATFGSGSQLVTLVGPGGMGKTRLAGRYARGWRGDYPGGAWFCDLAPARSIDGIASAVAQALDVPLGRSDSLQQLGTAIAARGECLLVLDNFEHLMPYAHEVVNGWLRMAPRARLLITSRENLSLPGEQVIALEPLTEGEACQLFQRRLRASGLPDPGDPAAVARLVALIDCMPLAIELAAARARLMSPAEQVRRIGERFLLLAARGRIDRHATLRASIDWSWELLGRAERQALAQLSVFEGGFTLDSVEAVLDLSAIDSALWPADLVQALLEKSLLRRASVPGRWEMLNSVREYANVKLRANPDDSERRHWHYFARISEDDATAGRCAEIGNLVVACRRASAAAMGTAPAAQAVLDDAVGALANAWAALARVGLFKVGLELATPLLQLDQVAGVNRARVGRVAGASATLLGKLEEAAAHFAEGVGAAAAAGDSELQSLLQVLWGEVEISRGRLDKAELLLEAALDAAGHSVAPRIATLNAKGGLALARSLPAQAERSFIQALQLAEQIGHQRWIGGLNGSVGVALISLGRPHEARPHVEASARIAEAMADRQWTGIARCNLGLLLHALGEHDGAARQLQWVVADSRDIGHRRLQATALCNLGLVELARRHVDAAALALRDAVDTADALGATRLALQCRAYLAQALSEQGNAADAMRVLQQAEATSGGAIDEGLRVLLLSQQARVLVGLERMTEAKGMLDDAEAIAANSDAIDSETRDALCAARALLNWS